MSNNNYSTLLVLAGTAVTASIVTLTIQQLFSGIHCRRQSQRAPKRCAGAIKLKRDQFHLYTQLHDYPWEEVLDRMHNSNIRNFTIYFHKETSTLFHHFDWIGGLDLDPIQDKEEIERRFQRDMEAIGTDAATREWWGYCEPCQEPFKQWLQHLPPPSQQTPPPPAGDWWAPLVCLTHCGYWPVAYSNQKRDLLFVPQNPDRKTCSRSEPPEVMDTI